MCDFDPWETTVQNTTHIWTVMFLLKFKTKKKNGRYSKNCGMLEMIYKIYIPSQNINSRRKEVRHYSNRMQANLSKFAIYSNYQFKEKNYWRILLKTNLSSHHLRYIDISHVFFDRKDLFQWVSLRWSFVINYYIVLVLHPRLRKIFCFFKFIFMIFE